MPDQTDRLLTVIQMQGVSEAVAGLKKLAEAAQGAGGPLSMLTARAQALPGIMGRLNLGTAEAAGGFTALAGKAALVIGILRGVTQEMEKLMTVADPLNQALARAVVLSANSGRAATFAGLAGLARQRLAVAGIEETSTLNLAGQMAERGFSTRRINSLLPALQDIETGTGGRVSAQSAMQMFLRVLERPVQGGRGGLGGGRGLIGLASQLGLNIRFSGNIENDLNRLTEAIHSKFGGVAEALAQTASGTHLRLQKELAAATARLGTIIEVALMPEMSLMVQALSKFNAGADFLLHGGGQGMTNALGVGAGAALAAGNVPLALGLASLFAQRTRERGLERVDGRSQQEADDIHQIAANTQRMASLVAQSVFGQISSFTRGAMTYRELNMAISIRSG